MAMACLADRAPCLPSRMWCISSRMNSPACVVGALPSRLSRRARSMVSFSGMGSPCAGESMQREYRGNCQGSGKSGQMLPPLFLNLRHPNHPAADSATGVADGLGEVIHLFVDDD